MITHLLRPSLFTLLAALALPSHADTVVQNAAQWREAWLQQAGKPAELTALRGDRGCSPTVCSIDIGDIAIVPNTQRLTRLGGAAISLKAANRRAGALPALDFEPIGNQGQAVYSHGKRWGTCLEFSHEGLGKSGTGQRWQSVVLVPWAGSQSASQAWRFVGYWAACDQLVEGPSASEVSFPALEALPGKNTGLRLNVYQCKRSGCSSQPSAQTIHGDPSNAADGSLTITSP